MNPEQSIITEAAPARFGLNNVRKNTVEFIVQNPLGAAGALILIVLVIAAFTSPIIAPYDQERGDFLYMSGAPNSEHVLGTDHAGRDVLSRVMFGAQTTLLVAFIAVLCGTTVGALLGVASAYLGGKTDLIMQRAMEILQAFPDLILALLLLAALNPSLWTVTIAISVTRIPFGGRVIRSVALQIREMDYVTAARAIGATDTRVMLRHVTPQCGAPFLVLATAHLGVAILIEASLGFLGAGVPPPTATWGNMLSLAATSTFKPLWWLVVFPGLAITVTVLAFNLLGDALRDVLDPRLRNR